MFIASIITFIASWLYITVGQVQGKYVQQQAYPLCNVDLLYENGDGIGIRFFNIIGDGKCQSLKGEDTNII